MISLRIFLFFWVIGQPSQADAQDVADSGEDEQVEKEFGGVEVDLGCAHDFGILFGIVLGFRCGYHFCETCVFIRFLRFWSVRWLV